MKRSIACAIAALSMATAPVTAQEYLKPSNTAPSDGAVQQNIGPTEYILVTKTFDFTHLVLPEGLQPGDALPIGINAVVYVDAAAPYLPAKLVHVVVSDITLADAAGSES